MGYQEDFQKRVIDALKAKNLAVDLTEQEVKQAALEESAKMAESEKQNFSADELLSVVEAVSLALSASSYSGDFRALGGPPIGGGSAPAGTINKDIIIVPSAGTASSINGYSQIDFKFNAVNNSYTNLDATETKLSLYNWAERAVGNAFDTPIMVVGGSWGSTTWAPNTGWGVGQVTNAASAGYVTSETGAGTVIIFKPASSTIYAGLFNNMGLDVSSANRQISITGYSTPVPNANPTAGIAISFGGTGQAGNLWFGGAASNSQTNNIRFFSPLTVANSTVTDTLFLSYSTATGGAGGTQYFVGGGTTQYVLSTNSQSFAQGDLFYASGTGHTSLIRIPIGANNTYLFSNGTIPSWTSSIAANTVQVVAASGSTILYPVLNNSAGSGAALSTDVDFSVDPGANILRYATGSFYVGTAVSTPIFTSNADVDIKPGANSATGVQITNTGNTVAVVNVDTSNNRVGINNVTSPQYTLDVAGDINASTGQSYRIAGTVVLNANTLGSSVVTSSLTALGTVTTGTWSATAITAFYGGTGYASYTVGDILYANTINSFAKLGIQAANTILTSTGTAPQWTSPALVTVGTATTANNVNIAAIGATNQLHYLALSRSATGTGVGLSTDTALTWVDTTGVLSSTIFSGTAVSAQTLAGTLVTASQPNVTTMSGLVSIGTITTGVWAGTAITARYGGIGDFSGTGKSYRILVMGAENTAVTTIDNTATTGAILMNNGFTSAPSFTNTFTGAYTFNSTVNFANNLPTAGASLVPVNATDLVTKAYADSAAGGLDVHASVRVATTAGIAGSYRSIQGSYSGYTTSIATGALIISTAQEFIGNAVGFDTVSGAALTTGQRVLIKNGIGGGFQTAGNAAYVAFSTLTTTGAVGASYVANGIYTITSYGGVTSNWILTRATDTDDNVELTGGTFAFVEEGTNFADLGFVCTVDTSYGPIGFGGTQITFTQFSGAGAFTVGQGLRQTGNTIAMNFNLTNSGTVYGTNAYAGFSLGGVISGSVGNSSYATLTVTNEGGAANNNATATILNNTTGFKISGGQTARAVTVAGTGDQTITYSADGFSHAGGKTLAFAGTQDLTLSSTAAGNGLTISSNSTLSLNSNTFTISSGTANITFQSGSASGTTASTIRYIVQNGQAQYTLSTPTATFGVGDLYYGSGTAYTGLTRLAAGTNGNVLIQAGGVPTWNAITLSNTNSVTGILPLTNGGTNGSVSGIALSYNVAVYDSAGTSITRVPQATAAKSVFIQAAVNGNPSWTNGPLGLDYGGTNAALTANAGGVVYSTSTAFAINSAGTANQVLLSGGSGAPTWSAITLSNSTTVTGILPLANGGTNGSISGIAVSYNLAIYDSAGTSITRIPQATAANSVLVQSAVNGNPSWTNGPLPIVNGGTNASTFSNTANNALVYHDGNKLATGTAFTTTTGGNLYISGNLFLSGTQAPTGTAAANQVAYWSSANALTGAASFQWVPGATSGSALTIAPSGAGTFTGVQINASNASFTGNILDLQLNATSRFKVDFNGVATHAGNAATTLIVTGGKSTFAAATSTYATLNIPSGSGPGAAVTQTGDLWFDGTSLWFRKSATVSQDLLMGSVTGAGTIDYVTKWASGTAITISSIRDSGFGVTVSTNATGIAAGNGGTAVLTIQTVLNDDLKTDRFFVRGISSTGSQRFSVDTNGNLRANTKSFDIEHPTKSGKRLVYGVLEGPEHGVYHRGTIEGKGKLSIELPEYWYKLVGSDYTVQLTPWGNYAVSIVEKTENYFTIQLVGDILSKKFRSYKVDYIVHGARLDAPLETEQ